MNITLFTNFTKRKNSTRRPTGTGTAATVYFKENCSVHNPVFLINGVDLNVNYVRFNNNYYFVDDIVLGNNNIYELHCSLDVLASYRTEIGSYNAFVERCSTTYDTMVNDNLVSSTQEIAYANKASTNVGIGGVGVSGCYVFRTASKDGPKLYVTDNLSFLGSIYSNTTYGMSMSDINSIVASLGMSALDASQYLTSVMWVPYSLATIGWGTQLSSISLGFWNQIVPSGVNVQVCDEYLSNVYDLNIPAGLYPNDFKNASPDYTRYQMFLPGVGSVALNVLDAARGNIKIGVDVDFVSGAISYRLYHATSGNVIATFDGQIGVPYPMVTTSINSSGVLESITSAAVGIASSSSWVGAVAAGAAGAVSAVKTMANAQGSLNSRSGNISAMRTYYTVVVSIEQFGHKNSPGPVAGRPLYEMKVINTLSGYIKCGNASIDIPGEGPDKEMVNSYLNSGFYYE